MKLILVFVSSVLVGALLSALVVAQDSKDSTVDVPAERQYDSGHCYEYQMKMLYAATNVNDPLQESYLRAAQAYRELDAAGQRCDS